ncbi:MAG: hypothetical protein HOA14_14445 [Planctomycetaceae bacterium]|jgi:hypothetical protein|nr:hypothetical protein [Planctomycetaceae bacterium]MBT6848611.1 hypothetical protein [Planctomycetaceae bacterium]
MHHPTIHKTLRSRILDLFAEFHDSDIDDTTPIIECIALDDSRYIGRRFHYENLIAVCSHEQQTITLFVDKEETVTMPVAPNSDVAQKQIAA